MLFQILQPQSAVFVDRLTAFNFKIGEVIIPDEGVVQSVLLSWILEGSVFIVFPHFLVVLVMKCCCRR